MGMFSWYTLNVKDEYGRYLGSKVFGEGSPFAFRKCHEYYKPNRKGGHKHNHARNVLERKLNKSKASRKRCHNHLNKGFNYKFIAGRCLRRVK